jgi:hypothetical protein
MANACAATAARLTIAPPASMPSLRSIGLALSASIADPTTASDPSADATFADTLRLTLLLLRWSASAFTAARSASAAAVSAVT